MMLLLGAIALVATPSSQPTAGDGGSVIPAAVICIIAIQRSSYPLDIQRRYAGINIANCRLRNRNNPHPPLMIIFGIIFVSPPWSCI